MTLRNSERTGRRGDIYEELHKKLTEIVHEKDFDYDKLFRALAVAWLEKGTLQNAYNQINKIDLSFKTPAY